MNNCSKYIVFRLKNIQVLSLHSIIFNKFRNIYCDFYVSLVFPIFYSVLELLRIRCLIHNFAAGSRCSIILPKYRANYNIGNNTINYLI